MKDLTDFAVLCKGATIPSTKEYLRVIPLASAPSVSAALKGIPQGTEDSLVPENLDKNMPKNDAGVFIDNVVKLQHKSDGYCRIVAKLTNNDSLDGADAVVTAKGFVLLQLTKIEGKDTWKPIAVASLDAGIDLTQPEIYVAFTFSKTNNYQSVSFNPNAFATIEDINEINGLDGLHIAFDHASGDIKILDGEGKVLDQANLHMDADTIIADGEEGYKYVKTDIQQDIHAEKDFMPAGKTAGADVEAETYSVQKACFLVDVTEERAAVTEAQAAVTEAQAAVDADPEDQSAQSNLEKAQSDLSMAQAALAQLLSSKAVREGTSDAIVGIRVSVDNEGTVANTDYVIGGSYNNNKIGVSEQEFLINESPKGTLAEVYSPEAFVWTVGNVADLVKEGDEDAGRSGENVGKVRVKEDGTITYRDLTFAEQMNVNAQALGFHIGDDIPLGTNIPNLVAKAGNFDVEAYMHGDSDEEDYIDELVDAQRNLAKDELVAWNAQHPALTHDPLNGTRISKDGLDVRNGKIEIGNGVANADSDSVKRYVIETDIDKGARADTGLQISVVASQTSSGEGSETVYTDVQKDILTINAEDYISGAPTCLALLKCEKETKGEGTEVVSASLTGGRITANFNASGSEVDGAFSLTITDNRANNGFGDAPRIVEIIPVYKSGADASEAVPAQRSISAIAYAKNANGTQLTIKCSQVLDWAQSIDLGGTVETVNSESGTTTTDSNGMELYLIVKVY